MDIVKISMLGVGAMLLSVFFKGSKQEYGIYICLITGVIIFSAVMINLLEIKGLIEEINSFFSSSSLYLGTLFKMVGITYLAEFSSSICKDAGYAAIACQIEVFGKVAVLLLSLPVVMTLLETLNGFLR